MESRIILKRHPIPNGIGVVSGRKNLSRNCLLPLGHVSAVENRVSSKSEQHRQASNQSRRASPSGVYRNHSTFPSPRELSFSSAINVTKLSQTSNTTLYSPLSSHVPSPSQAFPHPTSSPASCPPTPISLVVKIRTYARTLFLANVSSVRRIQMQFRGPCEEGAQPSNERQRDYTQTL